MSNTWICDNGGEHPSEQPVCDCEPECESCGEVSEDVIVNESGAYCVSCIDDEYRRMTRGHVPHFETHYGSRICACGYRATDRQDLDEHIVTVVR